MTTAGPAPKAFGPMKVTVEDLSSIEKKLSVEVPPEQVAAELDRAYNTLSRQVKIAGFRPGKVPRRILEQRFREQVEDDVIQRVVERSYLNAIKDNKVEVVSRPQVTNGALKPNEPFTYQARVEVKPKLEVKDYKGLALKKAERTVPDSDVTEQLQTLRENASRLEPIEDRKVAQPGDFAIIDYTASIEGKPFPGSEAQDVTVEVAPGELVSSKIAALEGVEVGSAKDIDYAFASDYRVEEVRGKVARFHVTVKGLKKKVTPELDDSFAKEVGGGAQTLDELKTKVKDDLQQSVSAKADAQEREELLKALIEKNAFEVPTSMVERALDSMLEGAVRNLARSGLDPRMLDLDFGKIREELRERAVREVKGALILEAMARQENITTDDAEVNARMERLATETGQPLSVVRKHFRDPDERESLALRLREEKSVEFLKANAKYS